MQKQKYLFLGALGLIIIGTVFFIKPLSEQHLEKSLFTKENSTTPGITQENIQEAVLGKVNEEYYWKSVDKEPLLQYQAAIHSADRNACEKLPTKDQEGCRTEQALLTVQKSEKKSLSACAVISNSTDKANCKDYVLSEQALAEEDITKCSETSTSQKKEECESEVIKRAFFLTLGNTPSVCQASRDAARNTLCTKVQESIMSDLLEAKKQRIAAFNQTNTIVAAGDYHKCIETNGTLGMYGYCQIKILEKEVTEKRITKTEACSILDNTTPLPVLTNTDTYTVETLPLREACEKLIKE